MAKKQAVYGLVCFVGNGYCNFGAYFGFANIGKKK
jgi:hypothetical protein